MRLVRKTGLFAQKGKCLKSYADAAGVKCDGTGFGFEKYDCSNKYINTHIFTSESGSQPVVISVQKSVQNARKILGINPLILLDLPAASPHTGAENQQREEE